MFRIAVCDDSPETIRQMKEDILKMPQISCRVDTYLSGRDFLSNRKNYDLIFLDIDMPGLSGIETGRRLREYDKKVKIVYVTSYREFAGQAFSVHAFSYMVKPVKREALYKILQEAFDYICEETVPVRVEFDTLQGSVVLDVKDIIYFEFISRKVRICIKGGELMMKGRITDVLYKMQDYGFEMPHKSYVVNLYHIRSVVGNDIYMTNGDRVLLSQKKAAGFRQILCEYIEKQMG
ncbi:MAG TPA: response regulator transcription factor [Candidatus Scybalocola faecavium]|nr:response regulator transcription factor [Candidatus Scybalocola faecavium]